MYGFKQKYEKNYCNVLPSNLLNNKPIKNTFQSKKNCQKIEKIQEKSTNDSINNCKQKTDNITHILPESIVITNKVTNATIDSTKYNEKTFENVQKASYKFKSSKIENNDEFENSLKEMKSQKSNFSNKLDEKTFMMTVLSQNSYISLFPQYSKDEKKTIEPLKISLTKNSTENPKDQEIQKTPSIFINTEVEKRLKYINSDKSNYQKDNYMNLLEKTSNTKHKHKKASDSLNISSNKIETNANQFTSQNLVDSPTTKGKKKENPSLTKLISSKSNDRLNFKQYKEIFKKNISNSNDFNNIPQNNFMNNNDNLFLSANKLKQNTSSKLELHATAVDFLSESVGSTQENCKRVNSQFSQTTPRSLQKNNSDTKRTRPTLKHNKDDSIKEFTEIEDEIRSQQQSLKDSQKFNTFKMGESEKKVLVECHSNKMIKNFARAVNDITVNKNQMSHQQIKTNYSKSFLNNKISKDDRNKSCSNKEHIKTKSKDLFGSIVPNRKPKFENKKNSRSTEKLNKCIYKEVPYISQKNIKNGSYNTLQRFYKPPMEEKTILNSSVNTQKDMSDSLLFIKKDLHTDYNAVNKFKTAAGKFFKSKINQERSDIIIPSSKEESPPKKSKQKKNNLENFIKIQNHGIEQKTSTSCEKGFQNDTRNRKLFDNSLFSATIMNSNTNNRSTLKEEIINKSHNLLNSNKYISNIENFQEHDIDHLKTSYYGERLKNNYYSFKNKVTIKDTFEGLDSQKNAENFTKEKQTNICNLKTSDQTSLADNFIRKFKSLNRRNQLEDSSQNLTENNNESIININPSQKSIINAKNCIDSYKKPFMKKQASVRPVQIPNNIVTEFSSMSDFRKTESVYKDFFESNTNPTEKTHLLENKTKNQLNKTSKKIGEESKITILKLNNDVFSSNDFMKPKPPYKKEAKPIKSKKGYFEVESNNHSKLLKNHNFLKNDRKNVKTPQRTAITPQRTALTPHRTAKTPQREILGNIYSNSQIKINNNSIKKSKRKILENFTKIQEPSQIQTVKNENSTLAADKPQNTHPKDYLVLESRNTIKEKISRLNREKYYSPSHDKNYYSPSHKKNYYSPSSIKIQNVFSGNKKSNYFKTTKDKPKKYNSQEPHKQHSNQNEKTKNSFLDKIYAKNNLVSLDNFEIDQTFMNIYSRKGSQANKNDKTNDFKQTKSFKDPKEIPDQIKSNTKNLMIFNSRKIKKDPFNTTNIQSERQIPDRKSLSTDTKLKNNIQQHQTSIQKTVFSTNQKLKRITTGYFASLKAQLIPPTDQSNTDSQVLPQKQFETISDDNTIKLLKVKSGMSVFDIDSKVPKQNLLEKCEFTSLFESNLDVNFQQNDNSKKISNDTFSMNKSFDKFSLGSVEISKTKGLTIVKNLKEVRNIMSNSKKNLIEN